MAGEQEEQDIARGDAGTPEEGSPSGSTAEDGETAQPEPRKKRVRLDEEVEASGWKGDMQKQLEEVRVFVFG